MMTTNLPPYFSPRRKRAPSESEYYSPSTSPTSTVSLASLQEVRFQEEETGRHSPRAAVAGRFKELAIRGLTDLGLPNGNHTMQEPSTAPILETPLARDFRTTSGAWPNHSNLPNEDLSYQSSASVPLTEGTRHEVPNELPLTPSKKTSAHLRKSPQRSSPSKRKQRLSPPLGDASQEDPFTWHDHEITGHDPTDPTDDGYGINGVGFKPTAAMAWARSQKRQKQVAEWKNREAREAREKRRERRNDKDPLGMIHGIQHGAIQKRVKFDV
ncbi:hypothetical protein N7540_006171 [Penicillium herquei]|nr:hypothetical protein N7540_006171 [Penicillium herquei]